MENVLLKLARQLVSYDEASLANLWDKYAELVEHFEPTKRWEEAVLILGLIQSVRFKNQLFNHHWAAGRASAEHPAAAPQAPDKQAGHALNAKAKILAFKPKEE